MRCLVSTVTLLAFLLFFLLVQSAATVKGEADRLWLVGSHAYADQLYSVALRMLERFVQRYPEDARLPEATLLLGKTQLALGELGPALESFRRAQRFTPPPGQPEEVRFWEGETLLRSKRCQQARAVFDALLTANAASPFAPDARYGAAWCELQLKHPERAATGFREFLKGWPEHSLAPAATYYLARALVELKQTEKAGELLAPFASRYQDHPLLPEARYLLGWSRVAAGKTDAGIADLRAFLADYPTHELVPQARRALTEALLRQGRKPELAKEYRALVSQSPATAEELYDAGLIALELGRPKDAESAWGRLRRAFPSHLLARRASLELARAAFKRNEFKDAAALARAASESEEEPVRLEAFLLIGESELKNQRFQAALKAFEAALALKSGDQALRLRALAGSGLAHEGLDHWEEAAARYEKVAAESTDPTLKEWAQGRLAAVQAKAQPKPKPQAEKPAS